jgi:hypothetical protein
MIGPLDRHEGGREGRGAHRRRCQEGRFKSEADAIKMANDTEFGLASYFYSRDIGRLGALV